MRLAVLYPVSVCFDGQEFRTDAYQHHQFRHLAGHFQSFDLVVLLRRSERCGGSETIDTTGIRVLGLPHCGSGRELYLTRLHRWMPALVRLLRRNRGRWDAVLLYDLLLPNQVAYALCRLLHIPVVAMLGGHHADGVLAAHREGRRGERLAAQTYARWVARVERHIVSRVPTAWDTNPVAGAVSRRHSYVGAMVEQQMIEARPSGGPGAVVRLLTVARVVPIKGIEFAVEAVRHLRNDGVAARLRVVGPLYGDGYAAYEHRLRRLVRALGLEDAVEFAGPVPFGDELWKVYRDADILVVPSLSEGVPKVIPEALARGLPVVATRVGGIPRVLEGSGAGLVVPPKDARAIAVAVKEVAAGSDRYSAAAIRVAGTLSAEVQMAGVAMFIHEAVGNRRAS